METNYQPIENYGIIGNMRSVALVGIDGSIDWFCFPNFDSPSVFAKILDSRKGGFFSIEPDSKDHKNKQFYWPDTNVLVSRFLLHDGIVEVTDYMPVGDDIQDELDYRIVRKVRGIHGKVSMKMKCKPAFNYARDKHEVNIVNNGAVFSSAGLNMGLSSTHKLSSDGNGAAIQNFEIEEDETVVFVLHKVEDCDNCQYFSEQEMEDRFINTIEFWRNWISKSTYKGRWREMVNRSALILKLLTFEPTGAIVAAPTCSLPEGIGTGRTWDYRYTWVRDAAFTVYAFMRIGFTDEAARFMNWITKRCGNSHSEGTLQIMYGIDGRSKLEENILDHLEGYHKSGPVRIGNGAYDQLQLDIYGELMDSAYLFNKYGEPVSYDTWTNLVSHVEWVCENWKRKDEGIWEVRSGKQHFVYSKLMCWVAVDRGIRLAIKRSFPADIERWRKIRDEIYLEIMEKGWNEELQTFVQSYDSSILDAANLMMPLVLFLSPTDPRMISTLELILKSPSSGGLMTNSLVYRYNNELAEDGLEGQEGTFNICTFWLVEALTRAGKNNKKYLEEARLIFEQMLGYANHVGMFSEELGLGGEALGNTPQAFTHLALISSAYNLDKALG